MGYGGVRYARCCIRLDLGTTAAPPTHSIQLLMKNKGVRLLALRATWCVRLDTCSAGLTRRPSPRTHLHDGLHTATRTGPSVPAREQLCTALPYPRLTLSVCTSSRMAILASAASPPRSICRVMTSPEGPSCSAPAERITRRRAVPKSIEDAWIVYWKLDMNRWLV